MCVSFSIGKSLANSLMVKTPQLSAPPPPTPPLAPEAAQKQELLSPEEAAKRAAASTGAQRAASSRNPLRFDFSSLGGLSGSGLSLPA